MSHFTVLVITDDGDYDTPLRPFYEQGEESDDFMDVVLEPIDVADAREYLAKVHAYDGDEERQLRAKRDAPPLDATDQTVAEWYHGEDSVKVMDGQLFEVSITNSTQYGPNGGHIKGAKWDWYTLGGRWSGALKLRQPQTSDSYDEAEVGGVLVLRSEVAADQAQKCDIDIEGMRADAVRQAEEAWAKYEAVVAEHGPLPSTDWTEIEDKRSEEFEAARAAYWAHPTIEAMRKAELIGWFGMPNEEFDMPREEFIERARLEAVPGFAVLARGEWFEPGGMGWFGFSTDTPESRLRYLREVNQIIDETPDDFWFSVVDCHI